LTYLIIYSILYKARQTEFTVLNIVTHFSILHAGGRVVIHDSDFKLVQSKFELAIAEATPFNCSARGGGAKAPYSYLAHAQGVMQLVCPSVVRWPDPDV
jgi:hypothetical protein